MSDLMTIVGAIGGTVLVYLLAVQLYKKVKTPFTLPILTATIVLVLLLLSFDFSYDTYYTGAQWIDHLLGPAVVALAYPLYMQLKKMRPYVKGISVGVICGSIVGLGSGVAFSLFFSTDWSLVASVAPKSITTPVAMEVSAAIGGVPILAALFVMIAGIGGASVSPFLFRWLKIKDDVARGVALGTASHAVGTSKALEEGEGQGAASTIAMSMSAVFVVLVVSIYSYFYL